jgi:hypothetical protein
MSKKRINALFIMLDIIEEWKSELEREIEELDS